MSIAKRLKLSCLRCKSDRRRKSSLSDPNFAERYALPADTDKYAIKNDSLSCNDLSGGSLTLRHAVRGVEIPKVWFAYRDSDANEYIGDKQLYMMSRQPQPLCASSRRSSGFFRLTAA